MNPAIKKLKTCLYSDSVGPSGFFARESFQPTKLVCGHLDMKKDWTMAVCADCKVYVNRNQPPQPEISVASPKKKISRKGTKPR